jgi:putative phosphoribosyl transferase
MLTAGHAQEPVFEDRRAAGRLLVPQLAAYAGRTDVVVLGLPRGGVPVAYEVALALGAPLDVLLVRKLGVPGHEELAFGAIASGGVRVLNSEVVAQTQVTLERIELTTAEQQLELERREQLYRDGAPALELTGRIAILVDDGLATGATMRAAVQATRIRQASPVVAVPVGPARTLAQLRAIADSVICTVIPREFVAVGFWYSDFTPTSDECVRELLARSRQS